MEYFNAMNEKEFVDRCHTTISHIESVIESAVNSGADIDFEVQGGILEIECFDESKIIISPHSIAKELWVAARSGGFHFRFDLESGWIDTRSGETLYQKLSDILKQQGQIQVNLA